MDLRRLRCCGCNRVERARWIATARTRATFAFRLRRKALDAAIATCAVRYSARDLLSQRRLVESLALCTQEAGRVGVARKGKPWLIDAALPDKQFERARCAAARLIHAGPEDV